MQSSSTGEQGSLPCSPTLEWAANLLACGVNAFPLAAGTKKPANGFAWKFLQHERLIDRDVESLDKYLCSWWDGSDYGLGAVTGTVSGIVVVDVDSDTGQELFDEYAPETRTVTARTRKGRHFWFSHPGGTLPNKAAVNGTGLDVRADGGFVVCPPTRHPDGGSYSWIVDPLDIWPPAPVPRRLQELLWPPKPPPVTRTVSLRPSSAYVAAAVDAEVDAVRAAPVGSRNDVLNRAAFVLGRFMVTGDLGLDDVVTQLLAAATAAGLPEHEARRTLASALTARRAG